MKSILENQTVVISGGSSGIGLAIALQLHNLGANIAVISRSKENLSKLTTRLDNERILTFAGDCADENQTRTFLSKSFEKFGPISIVIANAGVGAFGSVREVKLDKVQEMISTNLLGSITLVQSSLPLMEGAIHKDIVFITSTAGFRGGANEAAYAATKHGQVGYATALDRELRAEGFRISLIAPGNSDTEFGVGKGRAPSGLDSPEYLTADDVARQVVHVVTQPRHFRIPLISVLSTNQGL